MSKTATRETPPIDHPEAEDIILADWNADVPNDSDYAVKAWIDNNDVRGVAVDMNQERPEGVPVKPDEKPGQGPPDEEGAWIGDHMSDDMPGLPHSRYQSPDLTAKDPPDLEVDYSATEKVREDLSKQAEEREEKLAEQAT